MRPRQLVPDRLKTDLRLEIRAVPLTWSPQTKLRLLSDFGDHPRLRYSAISWSIGTSCFIRQVQGAGCPGTNRATVRSKGCEREDSLGTVARRHQIPQNNCAPWSSDRVDSPLAMASCRRPAVWTVTNAGTE